MNLQTWVPKLLVETPNDIGGTVITAQYWNNLWKLHQVQGDDTGLALKAVVDKLYATVLHPTEAAVNITNPELYDGGPLNVSDQLTEIQAALDTHDALIAAKRPSDTPLGHNVDTDITGTGDADCHPMSAITGLVEALEGITAGAVSAFDHNDIGDRDVADAHPISAITNLSTTLSTMQSTLTQAANIIYSPNVSVAAKIAALEQAINAITGGAAALTHNAILSRSVADCHPISSITSLQGALDTLAAADNYIVNSLLPLRQNKILASTSDPSGGVDGDVWIKYG